MNDYGYILLLRELSIDGFWRSVAMVNPTPFRSPPENHIGRFLLPPRPAAIYNSKVFTRMQLWLWDEMKLRHLGELRFQGLFGTATAVQE